jgi:asparagine synthase (glutamine-hydrolysing)
VSGIAGILQFDGAAVDPVLLRGVTDAMAHRGPDDSGYWAEGPVGLGHRQFWATPEALNERQPLHDADAGLCLTFDGRLDNREELARGLRGKGVVLRDDTDTELILRAYEVWGEESPKRLLGDFAYAIWDKANQRLFCARDCMGVRPFHYVHGGSYFLFASELQALFRDPRVRPVTNEGMIAEYLAFRITSHRETLFEGVERLPMAHCLCIDAGGARRAWRYWEPDFGMKTACRTDEEFAEAFLDVARASVRSRLRAHGPVGAELSGGLDSSTVSVIANGLLAHETSGSQPLQTYSIVYPNLPCDESEQIRATIQFARLRGRLLENDDMSPGYFPSAVGKYREFPGYPNADQHLFTVTGASRRDGCRVILTGQGGNEMLEGSLDYLADLVGRLRLLPAWRAAAENSGHFGCSAVRLLYRHGIRPWIRRTLSRPAPALTVYPWIQGELVKRVHLYDRLQRSPEAPSGASTMQRAMYDAAFSGHQAHAYEALERVTTGFGVDYRHPLLDRRFVEFCFALRGDQRWRKGKAKTVLRNAMATRLPSMVIDRGNQADFTILFASSLEAAVARSPMDSWTALSRGRVNLAELERRYNSCVEGYRSEGFSEARSRALWGFWMAYGMSLWVENA